MKSDLKKIKKYYGESMMHLCRELFPTILEEEGALSKILLERFAPSRSLYHDLMTEAKVRIFAEYVNQIYKPYEEAKVIADETPEELMDKAGYNLYCCYKEDDIQRFRKYYQDDETICTFYGHRLDTDHVFFAVKKNVDDIKRENFKHPKRDDEYGTSVISIQFSKDPYHILSIKNRYNHTVANPDATFSNNLENIIPGLTNSFAKYYGMTKSNNVDLRLDHYTTINNKFYRVNEYLNDVYYCENNYIIDNGVVINTYANNPERYIVLDYYIVDLKDKTISLYDERLKDSFPESLGKIFSFEVKKGQRHKLMVVDSNVGSSFLILNHNNQLIKADLLDIRETGDNFMQHLSNFQCLTAPRLEKTGDNFMQRVSTLDEVHLPFLKEVGRNFLQENEGLTLVELPSLKKAGDNFICYNTNLSYIDLKSIEEAGHNFLSSVGFLNYASFENLQVAGDNGLRSLRFIDELDMSNLQKVGDNFCASEVKSKYLYFPHLKETGDNFFRNNTSAKVIDAPSINKVGDNFLRENCHIKELDMPYLVEAGDNFLASNASLTKAHLDKCRFIGRNAFKHALFLEDLYMPELKFKGDGFMEYKENMDMGGKKL